MKQITETCKDCTECIPCKELYGLPRKTKWFHICKVLASDKDGFAMVIDPDKDYCEMFTPKGDKQK